MNNNMNEQNNQGINNTFSNNGMNTFANNMNQPNNPTFMNNNFNNQNNQPNNPAFMNNGFNNQNNQMTESMSSNNVGGQFNNNASNPATSEFLYNNSAVTNNMNQPNNPTFMNNNFNNQNTNKQKKNLKLLIGIGILIVVVIIIGVLVASITNKQDKNNNSSLNTSTNNNSSETTNNNSNDNLDDDSSDLIPLNTYANIAKNVDMKVNKTYVEDEYFFVIRTTFKNNGNEDKILVASSFGKDVVAYYQAYFIPKNVEYNEENAILESCNLRKIVRNDGKEITISSSSEDTILKAGETLDGMIHCSITRVEGKANGVNPLLLETQNFIGSNKTSKYFDLRN